MNFYYQRKINLLKTDVLPSELPILFSNNPICNEIEELMIDQRKYVEENIFKKYTVPLTFNIPKKSGDTRLMSLPHPLAQINMLCYILRYDKMIINFCEKSHFSRRSPTKINKLAVHNIELLENKLRKIEEDYGLIERKFMNSDDFDLLFKGYFSYNTDKSLTSILRSTEFTRSKTKFKYFLKLDINNCFHSIYTHSLTWAIIGSKNMGKNMTSGIYDHLFSNASDKICQKINNNETNGIIIGPEFSRIIAELLLTRVDTDLYDFLEQRNLRIKNDYEIYRYVDDYYIFADNPDILNIIKKELFLLLQSFNLTTSNNKVIEQTSPFNLSDYVISDLKKIINSYKYKKSILLNKLQKEEKYSNLKIEEVLGTQSQWADMYEEIEQLFAQNDNRRKIVLYFLKSINVNIPTDKITPKQEKFKIILKIIETISNIYSHHLDNDTTQYYLILMMEINNGLKKNLSENSYEDVDKTIYDIQEKMFYQIYRILNLNISNLENLYDLIVFLKILPKKLSSQFLCKILNKYKGDYFIYCTVAYYIKNNSIAIPEHKLVLNKLEKAVINFINNYENNGNLPLLLEANYFYMINDFSKYPLFSPQSKRKLEKRICENIKEIEIAFPYFNLITKELYYDWNKTELQFEKELVKKLIIDRRKGNKDINDYE